MPNCVFATDGSISIVHPEKRATTTAKVIDNTAIPLFFICSVFIVAFSSHLGCLYYGFEYINKHSFYAHLLLSWVDLENPCDLEQLFEAGLTAVAYVSVDDTETLAELLGQPSLFEAFLFKDFFYSIHVYGHLVREIFAIKIRKNCYIRMDD